MWLLEKTLVTSFTANPTWRLCPPFCHRLVSAMFPIVVLCLPERCQQHRLLPSFTLPHGEVINTTDAWSALYDSSPWPKETQSAWVTSLAEIHSLSCSTPQALGTTDGYSLHRKTKLLPGQKPSQLLASETCWGLMSSELQLPSEPVPIFSKARNAAVVSLLTGWGFMACPTIRIRAASPDIQPSTLSSNGHWPALVSPLSWSLLAWRGIEEGLIVWPWTLGTGQRSVESHFSDSCSDSAKFWNIRSDSC